MAPLRETRAQPSAVSGNQWRKGFLTEVYFECDVSKRAGGYCVECVESVETGKVTCAKADYGASCKCELKIVNGVKTCSEKGLCTAYY